LGFLLAFYERLASNMLVEVFAGRLGGEHAFEDLQAGIRIAVGRDSFLSPEFDGHQVVLGVIADALDIRAVQLSHFHVAVPLVVDFGELCEREIEAALFLVLWERIPIGRKTHTPILVPSQDHSLFPGVSLGLRFTKDRREIGDSYDCIFHFQFLHVAVDAPMAALPCGARPVG
jgi:hypothetical protein